VLDRRVEGVILVASDLPEAQLTEFASRMPIVVTHRHSRSTLYDTVVSNDDAGVEQAVRHLVELGHTRIAHIGPIHGKTAQLARKVAARRTRAYQEAMTRFGLERSIEIYHAPDYTFESGYAAARQAFTSPTTLRTAIVAGADNVAFGVVEAAAEVGLNPRRPVARRIRQYANCRSCPDFVDISGSESGGNGYQGSRTTSVADCGTEARRDPHLPPDSGGPKSSDPYRG